MKSLTVIALTTMVAKVFLNPLEVVEDVVPVEGGGDDKCVDVAVIGGGIGGAYTAWRLKDKGISISVFETTDRLGGRLLSPPLPVAPGTILELGGMRFKPGAHPLLHSAINSVGLNIIDFPLGAGNPDETLWYTRAKHMRIADIGTDKMPFNLDPSEQKPIGSLLWDLFNNNVNFSSNTYPSVDEMYSLVTNDGTPIYKMSLDNYLGRYASREAYHYIRDVSGWTMSVGRMQSIFDIKLLTAFPGDSEEESILKTVDGGMEQVPEKLMERFLEISNRHKLKLNHQLDKIQQIKGTYILRFRITKTTDGISEITDKTKMVCARKVVLAVNRGSVEEIDFPTLSNNRKIMKNINSVSDYQAGKIFLAYKNKWWKTKNEDITHTKSDLPNRQTYDWSTGTNGVSVIMASYHDGDNVDYWRELSQFGTPIPGSLPGAYAVTDVVKERAEKYLSAIYNVSHDDIPETVGGGMILWSNAWNVFKPGFDERKVREMMYKPSSSDDVYIVSNSWARDLLVGWSEGTLEAVDRVISKYFNQ